MRQIKIAITGGLRSGKSTVTDYITQYYDGFKEYAFGDELKKCFHDAITSIPENPKPRKAYQEYGEFMAQFDPLVWVKLTADKITAFDEIYLGAGIGHNIVISDLRKPVEYEWAKNNGYIVIRVNAPLELRKQRAKDAGDDFTDETLTHSTESFVDTFTVDYDVHNTGLKIDLMRQIDAIMTEIDAKKSAWGVFTS